MSETEDRYYVVSVEGMDVFATKQPAIKESQWGTSFSILDRAYCHREVARFYAGTRYPNGNRREIGRRRRAAEREAARLNRLDREHA